MQGLKNPLYPITLYLDDDEPSAIETVLLDSIPKVGDQLKTSEAMPVLSLRVTRTFQSDEDLGKLNRAGALYWVCVEVID